MASEKLLGLAARVGSDTPFLASDYVMALSWGRGDRLLRLKPLPSRDVQLFLPPFGIDTGEAYALLDQARGPYTGPGPRLTTEMFLDWNSASKNSVNDFEPVMRRRHREIDALLARGDRHGLFYRMSGSGSTVFKVTGEGTRPIESEAGVPPLEVPDGIKRIVTRTSVSVVPVELLD
jgi:4-diphosphocytidyl-2C-methyl-D-erythritol kinase